MLEMMRMLELFFLKRGTVLAFLFAKKIDEEIGKLWYADNRKQFDLGFDFKKL